MNASPRTARLAGVAYLINGVSSMLGLVCAPLVPGGAAALARAVAMPGSRFSVAIVADLTAEISSIVLVLLLYRLLREIHEVQAVLMAVLLVVATPISFVVSLSDVAARIFSVDAATIASLGTGPAGAMSRVFVQLHVQAVYGLELFWGLWLLPFGLLAIRSRFLPRLLGLLLIVACGAYLTHGLFALLVPGERAQAFELAAMAGRAAGELPMIFWLLVWGVRPARGAPASLR